MKFYLLLGAGFSRNWGGWLADEAFEYLLGTPEVRWRPSVRKLLWEKQEAGIGFEGALDELQHAEGEEAKRDLRDLHDAVRRMFADMNAGLMEPRVGFEDLRNFLGRFDAIFTLNQDLFLERHYVLLRADVSEHKGWKRPVLPGIRTPPFGHPSAADVPWHFERWRVEEGIPLLGRNDQPIYKLHGSSQWYRVEDQDGLMVLGGGKSEAIAKDPILAAYDQKFAAALNLGQYCRLMVIGYGFRDAHINRRIHEAGLSSMKVFVIDPKGAEAWVEDNPLERNGKTNRLSPFLIGASRRSMQDILESASVEGKKVMRFFEDDY